MIEPEAFVDALAERGIDFYTGVPDSLLKAFGIVVQETVPSTRHVIAANEGNAVGLAIGYHLRTGRVPVVYLQNSGIGNAINPLLSLADRAVYGIPMLVIVGWRGEPGHADEPQHVTQGRVMEQLLSGLDLPWAVLPDENEVAAAAIDQALAVATTSRTPFVLLVRKDTFAAPKSGIAADAQEALPSREAALERLVAALGPDAITVATTGMLSRELFELREQRGEESSADFLTVGGMGHASSIALGVALAEPDREVWCLDGDGALLMHAGALSVIGNRAPQKFFHVVFNNGVHDSVGGQPTAITTVDVPALALATGYRMARTVDGLDDLDVVVKELRASGGPALLELRVRPGARADLGRPTRTAREQADRFAAAVRRSS